MKNTFKAIVLVAAFVAASGSALAQSHGSPGGWQGSSTMQGMMSAEQMMTQCEQMMKEMRADPVLMQHMNQIMRKHMMSGGMMNGNMMQGGPMKGGMMSSPHPSPTPHP